MTEANQAQDTAGQNQQSVPASAEVAEQIEIVDTSEQPPQAQAQEPPAEPQLYFGKYRSIEEAEKAFKEAERTMHDKAQEAATYRKLIEERQAQPATPPMPQAVDMDAQIRERLAENPAGTIFEMAQFAARKMFEDQNKQQTERLRRYQSFASRPEFAPVAQNVASQLPFLNEQPADPIETMFLRERLRQLEEQVAGKGNGNNAPATPPQFVLPGNQANRAGNNSLRVELDPDTARLKGMPKDQIKELARIVAKQKAAGGTMNGMSIEDWEKANA